MQNTAFSINKTLNLGGHLLDLTKPRIMGILNVTPDSFSDGGRFFSPDQALAHAERMAEAGADLIDVGGYSSRPGAEDIPVEEELNRVIPVIRKLTRTLPSIPLSVDTFRAAVAAQAVDEGAKLINDISGGEADLTMFETAARLNVPYLLMHMRGTPKTMTSLTSYNNLMQELIAYFSKKILSLREMGVADILVDPGFGFAKTPEQGFHILKHLSEFHVLDCPVVVGLSRKSMIWRTLNVSPENADNGSTVLNTAALLKGASILRVHNVPLAVEAIKLTGLIR